MTDRQLPKTPRGIEARARRAPDGSWTWRYRVRWKDDRTGRRLVEELETVDEALDFQAHLRLARRRGQLAELDRGRTTIAEFVETSWWPHSGRNLERSTLESYAQQCNHHLLPRVGHLQLRQLTPPVVQGLRDDLERAGVGAPTIRRCLAILQAVCRHAVTAGELTSNPVQPVRKPAVPRRVTAHVPSPAEVEAIRAELDVAGAALVSLLAYEGLRPEEALALADGHVRRRTLLVERKLVKGRLVPGQKHHRAHRAPELFASVAKDLAEHRLAQQRPAGCTLLFPAPDGLAWPDSRYRSWRRWAFKAAVKRAGVPVQRPYDLRHACASLLLYARWSLPKVAAHLGHSIAVLSETYAHVIADLRDEPSVPVEQAIQRAREPELRLANAQ
jgi:integrase